ncbi:hypothetical protein MMSR116_17835 [Methylobacterium mesophilicum SR1.6/6]|uniref:Uncharacterized protein n=1 Tax=Methylobacterium mesophilicum SR1.6/6 TaxID=908290 RepID=A0A6B9FR64_9HYPH|nr:hypothetical protein [Methylobacterium mesophilicum]QGY03538.1 hypothetical protein MMSR116_17835 [Methylobacterium mesophilicum SR1.6/6]
MWTDFDASSHKILAEAEAAAARERARSKKRHKQPPRSKRKSNGAPHPAPNKLTLGKPTLSTASAQPAALVVQTDPVPPDLEAFRDEQTEAIQAQILHIATHIGALDSQDAQPQRTRIEHNEIAGVDYFVLSSEDADIISDNETYRAKITTSTASVLCAIEMKSPERSHCHGAFRRVGLAGMGLISLISALSLLNPGSHLEAEAPGTIDQAPVSVGVWTDPPPLEPVRSAADISPIGPQPKQQVVAAPTSLAFVQKAPPEVSPHTDLPTDNRLVEATSVPLVPVPQEVVQSASVTLVPLPPRRPVSLIARHIPVAHPVTTTVTLSTDGPAEPAVEQAEPPESYASFSARKHEIGTHKLPWGMARLHEDPNSDTGRGAVWDFVPTEP